jgi:hypothetical protein
MAAMATVREELAKPHDLRDLEAETARRIDQLVARSNAWRNGSIHSSTSAEGVEAAAS